MTATETAPASTATPAAPEQLPALYRILTTSDHKTVGRLYLTFSLAFLLLVLVVGILVGVERTDQAGIDVLTGEATYFQAYILWKIGLIVLAVVPLLLGLAMLVVPLQVGSPAIAFPRAAALSLWAWLAGGLIFAISIAADGGFGSEGVSADAVELTFLGLIITIVSLLLGAVCVATTVVSLRPYGMTLRRVPMFSWASLVGSGVWLLTLPVAIANLVIEYVRISRGSPELSIANSGFGWLLTPPQVFVYVIPALGILYDVLPTATKVRQNQRGIVMAGIALFGLLSFGAYVQPGGSDVQTQFLYLAMAFALLLPVLILLGGIGDCMMRGRKNLGLPPTALLFALLGTLVIFAGVAMGAIRAVKGFDLIDPRTSAADAVYAAALLGGLAATLGGVAWWASKITGRTFPELGRPLALLVGGGALVAAVPELIAGFMDQAGGFQSVADVKDGVEVMNIVSLVGVALVALGVLAFIGLLLKSMRSKSLAPHDPYNGQTLEWTTASPPPVGNFAAAPARVTTPQPLLDIKEAK